MKNKKYVFLFCALLAASHINAFAQQTSSQSTAPAAPQTKETKTEPNFKSIVGIAVMPHAWWSSGQAFRADGYSQSLDYDLDPNAFTTYEGSLWHKSGFSAGLSADVDNNIVGKLDRLLGFLGYKGLLLRVSGGKIEGTATWDGAPVVGQPQKADVKTKYQSVELMYAPDPMWYIGVSYTKYDMPVEIQSLTKNRYGNTAIANMVYDPEAEFKTYGFIFGFDNMNTNLLGKKEGFDLWAFTQDTFFAGTVKFNNEGLNRLREANPTKTLKDKNSYFTLGVQFDVTIGLQWVKTLGWTRLALGAGYNFSGRALSNLTGGPDSTREIVPDTSPYLFHHGPVIKAAMSF